GLCPVPNISDDAEVVPPSISRKRTVKASEHSFFSQNFQQMIKARPGVTAGYRETGRMHDRADFYPKLFSRCFHHGFNLGRRKTLHSSERRAHGRKSRLILSCKIFREAFRVVFEIII